MVQEDIKILKLMNHGESKRDATSKIRGFLFQDFLAIEELLDENTEFICSEYVEDILALRKDTDNEENILIYQLKYYPESTVDMYEVIRDLYYQFLRLKILNISTRVTPLLAVHCNKALQKPTLQDMRGVKYTNISRAQRPDFPDNLTEYLKTEIYPLKKVESENKLFETFSYDDYIGEFLECMKILPDKGCLAEYRNRLADGLENVIDVSSCLIVDQKMRKNVLLGLAVQFIQKTYINNTPDNANIFEHRKYTRSDFLDHIQSAVSGETVNSITAYMSTIAMDCYCAIEDMNPELDQNELDLLQCLRDNTAKWLTGLGNTLEGQMQLLNTISFDEKELKKYPDESIYGRLTIIAEQKKGLCAFLSYIWKILLDENQDLLGCEITTENRKKLYIESYLDSEEKRYLKFNFPNDTSDAAVVLPSLNGAMPNRDLMCIFKRMKEFQPTKWYLQGQYRGVHAYTQSVSEIIDEQKVSSIQPDSFRIECMNCIKVDMGKWHTAENCTETVFRDGCIQERSSEI